MNVSMAIGSPPSSPEQSPRSCGSPLVTSSTTVERQFSDGGSEEEILGDVPVVDPEDGDNVWDTDWITLASNPRVAASKPSGGPETFAAVAAAAEAATRQRGMPDSSNPSPQAQ